MKQFFITSIIFLFLFSPLVAQVASLDIVINEIAWMGNQNSSADEWIELYNNTNGEINLDGWGLYEEGGKTLIESLSGTIKAKSYYLVERTDEGTVPNIEASQPPTGWGGHGLSNGGEHLQLLDSNSNIVDEVNCGEGWFSGDKSSKQTMERINPLVSGNNSSNWQTSQESGGTPKAENSKPESEPEPEESSENAENNVAVKPPHSVPPLSYPKGVVFNEILPSPEGRDSENEWIEIFNQNNFEVNLAGWKIKDSEGRTTTHTFPADTKISPKGYLVLKRPETKITLNNTNDALNLIHPNGEVTDSIIYEKAPTGQSYNRIGTDWFWSDILTPGRKNTIPKKEKGETGSPRTLTAEKSEDGPLTAEISEKLPKTSNFFSTILISFTLAIFSGIIILILKKKVSI